jgi:enoyl-CoA hydratase/carnithine racemase
MGTITLDIDGHTARVTLANPAKLNAIDIAMWRELRAVFERLQAMPPADAPHAVIVRGADGQFASGGDIAEFAGFRFERDALYDFHENVVAPALHAMLDCDILLFAQIEGACIGGGLEIASCCDIRVCGESSRFGAPIAKLGFPMAPGELAVVSRVVSAPVLREMLLEARLFDARQALAANLVHEVLPDADVAAQVQRRAERLAELSPQAARLNKRTLRLVERAAMSDAERHALFDYADSAQHREGVTAFIEKRPQRFQRG